MSLGREARLTGASVTAGDRFSVILVNLDGAETLLCAVRSALAEGVAPTEITVVDNGSTDSSLAEVAAAAPAVTILRNGCNVGFARAVNQGLARTSGDFILLLNNDAELAPGALDAFALAFDTMPRLGIAGGQLRYPNGRLQSAFAPLPTLREELIPRALLRWLQPQRYRRSTAQIVTPRLVESVFGACLAVRVTALQEIGSLDEDFFFYFEEVEWCRRARLHGWEIATIPEARATHALGLTANRFRSHARVELQRSKLLYFRKCASPAAYGVLSIALILRTGVNAASGALLCILSLFQSPRVRQKARVYGRLFAWHLLGRPESWGLPGKCPKSP